MSKAKKGRKASKKGAKGSHKGKQGLMKGEKAAHQAGTPGSQPEALPDATPASETSGEDEMFFVVNMHSVYEEKEIEAGYNVTFDTFAEARAYALEQVEAGIETLQFLADALQAASDMASLDLGWHEPMLTAWAGDDEADGDHEDEDEDAHDEG